MNNWVATELNNINETYILLLYTHYAELLTYSWNNTLQVTSAQVVNQLCILSSDILVRSSDVEFVTMVS